MCSDKMSVTLIVEVIVLLQLLLNCHTGSSIPPECAEDCCNEGQIVTYECQVPAVAGILNWNGVGFNCPNTDTVANNVIGLPTTSCPLSFGAVHTGKCGPYIGNLTCTEDGTNLISVLEFKTNYEMNGGNISCEFLRTNRIETFPVRVGVAPNQPLNVSVETRNDRSCQIKWSSPNETIGGIGGYKIHYGENCDRCSPETGFVNQREELTAECIACSEEHSVSNMMCSFKVNTVSQDCSFDSPLVEVTSVLLPCKLETSSTRVKIHSTIGDIPPGMEIVPHNTTLYLSCDSNCTLDYNQTRCTNGKFQPSISHILRDGCRCSDVFAIVFGSVIGGIILVVVIMVVVLIIIYILYRRICKRETENGDNVVSSVSNGTTEHTTSFISDQVQYSTTNTETENGDNVVSSVSNGTTEHTTSFNSDQVQYSTTNTESEPITLVESKSYENSGDTTGTGGQSE